MKISDLPSAGGDAIKLEIGDTVKGRIVDARKIQTKNDPEPTPALILDVDGVEKTLWLSKFALTTAIKDAANKVGITELVGNTIIIKRLPDGKQTKAGFSPPHQFLAKLEKGVDENQDPF